MPLLTWFSLPLEYFILPLFALRRFSSSLLGPKPLGGSVFASSTPAYQLLYINIRAGVIPTRHSTTPCSK